MKRILLCLIIVLLVSSCSKKIHPVTTKTSVKPGSPAPTTIGTTAAPAAEINEPVKAPVVINKSFASPMIVIDETGKIITSRNQLPEAIAAKVDYTKITRSFTPTQRQNLIYRFKIVPPRVLYVPENMVSKSARGYYCVYKKKFWYWQKEDGLFHLDETYYQ